MLSRMQSHHSSTVFIAKDNSGQYGVHVSGFNSDTVKVDDLQLLFSKVGNVSVCKILMPQGIAFVKYLTLTEARSAINFDGYQLGSGDGVLRVRPAYVSNKTHTRTSTKALNHGEPSNADCTQHSSDSEGVLSPHSTSVNGSESNSDSETAEVSSSLNNIHLVDTTNSDYKTPSHTLPKSNASGHMVTLDPSSAEFTSQDSGKQLINNSSTHNVSQNLGSTKVETSLTYGNFSESTNDISTKQCTMNPTSNQSGSAHSITVQHVNQQAHFLSKDKTETVLPQISSVQSHNRPAVAVKTQPSGQPANIKPVIGNQLQMPHTLTHTGMQQCQYKYKPTKTPTINQPATQVKRRTPLSNEMQIDAAVSSSDGAIAGGKVPVNGAQLKRTPMKGGVGVSMNSKPLTVGKIVSNRQLVATMGVSDVVNYYKEKGYHKEAQFFEENEIDGKALELLDLKALLHVMKLGPAMKLQSVIKLLID